MDETALYADILKVEKPNANTRLVHARISDETKDLDNQVADYNWLKNALPDWFNFGNVREMHQSNVVGKATELTAVPEEKGFDGVLKIVDPLAIRKLDEELYGGVSIGIKSPRVINEKGAVIAPHLPGRIVGGKIVEVSLVDHPANENCKLVLAKSATGNRGTLVMLAEPEEIGQPFEDEVAWKAFGKYSLLTKRDFSASDRKRLAGEGKAMPDGSFPIANEEDLHNAILLAGHAKNPAAAKRHIIARAKAMGMMDAIPDDWKKGAEPDVTKDSSIPVLTGDESQHNKPATAALTAIKTLIAQELAEPEAEFDCINWLSGIAQSLIGWMNSEQSEYSTMGADADLFKATLDDFVQVAEEPSITKRRQFYDREHRAAIEQALQNALMVVQRDMQGPDTDDTTVDAPESEAGENRDAAGQMRPAPAVAQAGPSLEGGHRSEPDNAMAPGYELHNTGTRVSITDVPTNTSTQGVEQAGYDGHGYPTSTGGNARVMGADPDLTKAVTPDLDKAAIADAVKAIFPDLLKEYREALKEELKEEFAPKTLEKTVETMGKRAQPNNGPMLGPGTRAIEKAFAANATVNADTVPQEHLDKMVRLSELAKSDDVETAASARGLLKKMAQQYFQPEA